MTTPTIIHVEDVSKRFVMHKDKSIKERILNFSRARKHQDDFWALKDISLDITMGTTVGLVGHNGSGKSTLLKVVGGIIQPTTGNVSRRGRMAALLELGAGFHPDLTGRENVYLNSAILGLSRSETDRYFDEIVDFSGIEDFIDTQVKFYSSGMYVRLAFAVAVHVDPDLLLVDEVLAVGDEPFQRKCMAKIAQFQAEGRTIVLVSHSAEQVGALCDRVVVLEHGEMLHDGDPAQALRVLRGSFSDEQVRHEEKLEAEGRPEHHVVAVPQVSVTASRLDAASVIAPGSDIYVSVQYEVLETIDPWLIGVALETAVGNVVYRMTTRELGEKLPLEPGTYKLNVTFKNHNLGGGSYSVSVGLAYEAGETILVVNPAATFEVADYGIGRGAIRLDVESSVQRLEAARAAGLT
ncbi:ABC transporter ATP-binding protein [Cryobacterium sp. TMT2-17-1]|uniref:ABC transporter ATP-binding protein n=1 Tax=Cryobacterium sp. TMT2-17-1 TaxID=1259248 RepID=UPI0010690E3B|nr:ABC transporter ATP-binding protein [Cryobacterium sp. TMT2-17-1]TFC49472.1 ABC transporter ATP-binding protein [Cryobacterium sp. TMT2-17-1]